MVIDHTHKRYNARWRRCGKNRFNGAYYYSKEIVKNIIPRVRTDRNWVTVNLPGVGCDHSIVFVHNNLHLDHYEWLKQYNDVILVCGRPETLEKVAHIARAIYLPLSIDVEEVKKHRVKKSERKGTAFVGRPSKRRMSGVNLPSGIDIVEGLPREQMLDKMAHYETVYAVGRTAIEAKALGCKVAAYDDRYPKPSEWKILDNKAAAELLQGMLDKIDNVQLDDPDHAEETEAKEDTDHKEEKVDEKE